MLVYLVLVTLCSHFLVICCLPKADMIPAINYTAEDVELPLLLFVAV